MVSYVFLLSMNLIDLVLVKSHHFRITVHPYGNKMYRDMKTVYRSGMKRHAAEFVSKCVTCQRVNAKQKKPNGLLQHLDIPP